MAAETQSHEMRAIDGFALYNAQVSASDIRFVDACNKTMDTLLVFAGLFSAVLTAFIAQVTSGQPQDRTNELLVQVILKLNDTGFNPVVHPIATPVPTMLVNLFLFCSLTITLLSALLALLVKQWIHAYEKRAHKGTLTQEKARARRRAWDELDRSHMRMIISSVPILLHIALGMFLCSILAWLFNSEQHPIFYSVLVLCGCGLLFYVLTAFIGTFSKHSLFQWPLVTLLRGTFRRRWRKGNPSYDRYGATANSEILTTTNPGPEVDRLLLESKPDDVAILCQAVSDSSSTSDASQAIGQLRSVILLDDFDPKNGFKMPRDRRSAPARNLILLNKCVDIATSSVTYSGRFPWLNTESVMPARAVCEFLEVYLQLKLGDGGYLETLKQPAITALFDALHYHGHQEQGRKTDVVLAIALRALHSHRVMKPVDGCKVCFQDTLTLPSLFEIGEEKFVPKRDTEVNAQRLLTIHRCLRVTIVHLTDCLFFHSGGKDLGWDGVLEPDFVAPLHGALKAFRKKSSELKMLGEYLNRMKAQVQQGTRQEKWINGLWAPILNP